MEIQTFKNEKSFLTTIWQIVGGLGILFLLSGILKGFFPNDNSFTTGALLLCGLTAIPGFVIYRWNATDDFTVTTNRAKGLTIHRRDGSDEFYRWEDITETELIFEKLSEFGSSYKVNLHIFTACCKELKFPQSMENFHDFLDVVNLATTHLPYSWEYLDCKQAKKLGVEQTWYRTEQKPVKAR